MSAATHDAKAGYTDKRSFSSAVGSGSSSQAKESGTIHHLKLLLISPNAVLKPQTHSASSNNPTLDGTASIDSPVAAPFTVDENLAQVQKKLDLETTKLKLLELQNLQSYHVKHLKL